MARPRDLIGRLVLVLAAVLAGTELRGASNPAAGTMPLEIIVKFVEASAPGRRVRGSLGTSPTDLRPLDEIAASLHAATGVAMRPDRLTSGAELILGIPEPPLIETVREAVVRDPDVSRAESMSADHGNPNLPGSLLVIRFRDATAPFALLARATGDPSSAERVQALATRICAPSEVPVRGEAGESGELIVTVDRSALIADLVERLNALDDVEYAQANAVLQPMK